MSFIRKIKTEVVRVNGRPSYLVSRYVDNGEVVCKLNFKRSKEDMREGTLVKVAGVHIGEEVKGCPGLVPVEDDFFKTSAKILHLSRYVDMPFPIVIPEGIEESLKLQLTQKRITKDEYKMHKKYISDYKKMVKRQNAAKKKQDRINEKFFNKIFKDK